MWYVLLQRHPLSYPGPVPDPNIFSLEGRHHMLSRVTAKLLVWPTAFSEWSEAWNVCSGSYNLMVIPVGNARWEPCVPQNQHRYHIATIYPYFCSENRQPTWVSLGSEFYYHQCHEWEYHSRPWEVLSVPLSFTSSSPTLGRCWWEVRSLLLYSPPRCSGLWPARRRMGRVSVGDFVERRKRKCSYWSKKLV